MKKSLLALALFGAFAGISHAQSSVVVYGDVDVGMNKRDGKSFQIDRRDNNRLGFLGTEDLGNGLKALFQMEIRFDPDTGTVEASTRPLFQGQSRVGLQGGFGTVRLGRGLTALQESNLAFEPWNGIPSVAGFQTDLLVAGYSSDPLSAAGNSGNRFSNALFYNSPVMSGFQVKATAASKEANGNPAIAASSYSQTIGANQAAYVVPYSLATTFTNGPFAALGAYERNAIGTKLGSIGVSYNPVSALKLMALYARQQQGDVINNNPNTKSWVLGANYTMGQGKFLAGYGQKSPDGFSKTKEASLGYEYSLSTRTYVYIDASNKKQPTATFTSATQLSSVTFYGVGLHHNF